jgi:uracil-DNA glycosylase
MAKTDELKKLEQEIAANTTLPLREANLVFGEGNINCDVMFIGEAPGETEDRLKRPFVGRGGQLLDRMIESVGWKRANVYITNIVKRRPPQNRDPLPEEIAAYQPYLTKQIQLIDPKIIVTLGRFAMNYFLPDAKISRDHGRAFKVESRIIYPVYHPAAALRSPEQMGGVLAEDFKKLPKILKGEIAPEVAPAVTPPVIAAARKPVKDEKRKQAGLF